MYQRLFYIGLIVAAVLIVGILGVGAFYEYQIKPNQVLAKVNGYEIKRSDYWKYQSVVLYNQARAYESYALQVTGQQQTQFLSFAASFDQQREDIWGSTDVSDITVQQMVEDRLYIQGAEEMGIDLSDAAVQQHALNMFAPGDAPLETPAPSPTMIPQRAEWATQTAEALATQQALAMGTPAGSPAATPGASPVTSGATPVGTPAASPEATPDLVGSQMSAQSAFTDFKESVFDDAHLTDEEYTELFVKPQLARDRVDTQIKNNVPQTGEQVNAEHILVATEDLANQIYEQVTSGASFEEVAKTSSTDASTAPTGGKLGWFTRAQMVDPFSEAAFSLEPGQISQPVQTNYGWHIIKVLDKDPERALTTAQYTIAQDRAVSSWLDQQREKADISSDHYSPTPPPTPEQFAPPSDAPTPIMATPVPPTDVSATPVQGPVFTPSGTPAATPVGSPAASPVP
jgi:parvulin-like peptidyl-prolyl isomerase